MTDSQSLNAVKEQQRILVIDDVFAARRVTRRFLALIGYSQVEEACSGKEAFEILSNDTDFSLVIVDLNLGDTTAIELLERLKCSENFKLMPTILVSSEPDQSSVQEALKHGVETVLAKPFSKEKLSDALEEIFSEGRESC